MDEPTPRVVERFDLTHPPAGFVDDPFPWYAALRQTDPIHRCPDGSYLVTRYDDCLQVYRNSNFSSDKRRLFKPKFGASQPLRQMPAVRKPAWRRISAGITASSGSAWS